MTHYPLILAQQPQPELYFGNASHSSTSTSSFSFTSMNFNLDNPNRLVIVSVHWYKFDTTLATPSVTVGGVTATLVTSSSRLISGGSGSFIYTALYVAQPTGTTGTVAVQFASTADSGCSVATWSAYNLSSTTAAVTSNGNPSRSVTTQPGDVVIAAATAQGTNAATWTGLTEDYDSQISGFGRSGASAVTQTSGTLTIDATSGTSVTMSVGVWR